jgi:aldose 1-epimerase
MIKKSLFGKLADGREVFRYTITNKSGMQVNVMTYGAIVTDLFVPDVNGILEDVVLGYSSLEGYVKDRTFMGGIVGRYGNRIAKGKLQIGETIFQLACNDGENHLHGGPIGYNKALWTSETEESASGNTVTLSHHSPDGEEGYPGNLELTVSYTLTDINELRLAYVAITDAATVINPTHHSYFNLSGDAKNQILDHILQINSDNYLPVDAGQIPLGTAEPVQNTPMDFRLPIPVGLHINETNGQLEIGNGYDHTWALNNFDGSTKSAAIVLDPASRRMMEVFTDQPGLQFYSGNSLEGNSDDERGAKNKFRTGLCIEAQHFPDSPNNPLFPSTFLNPGEIYKQETIYKFSIKGK